MGQTGKIAFGGFVIYTALVPGAEAAGWIDMPFEADSARVSTATASSAAMIVTALPAGTLSDIEPDYQFGLPPKPIKPSGEGK